MTKEQIIELVNLYHLARTALAGTSDRSQYARMRWAVDEFRKTNPEVSDKRAYLELDRGPQ